MKIRILQTMDSGIRLVWGLGCSCGLLGPDPWHVHNGYVLQAYSRPESTMYFQAQSLVYSFMSFHAKANQIKKHHVRNPTGTPGCWKAIAWRLIGRGLEVLGW